MSGVCFPRSLVPSFPRSLVFLFLFLSGKLVGMPFAYVANEIASGTVSVIDTATNLITATIAVGADPYAATITPNGSFAYVANNTASGSVSVINTATNIVTATVAVGADPRIVAITPNGSFAYVPNTGAGAGTTVSVITTATNTVTATITVGTLPFGARHHAKWLFCLCVQPIPAAM